MARSLLTAFAIFTLFFLGLRGLEWLYHRLRHSPDWSPHWGSWAFAVLMAVYAFVTNVGR